MRQFGIVSGLLTALVVLRAAGIEAQDLVATTEPLTAEEQLTKFHLPPGFKIQLVAAEPDIRKPMNLNFDAAGRLYATQSVEYPFPAEGDAPKRDVVKVLAGFGPDGKAQNITTFIDGLNIPIGVLPVHGGLVFHSIPHIQFAPDSDGNGQADSRQMLYETFGYRDTHGMASSFTRWVDGWIYACHGFANDSTVRGSDGQSIQMNSGNTYRIRRDGSRIEQFTWGQVNPFGLAFDPLGNLYSADCHSRPIYMLLRGARYPSFGKPHDGLGYGPAMISHDHGSTGIGGVVYYSANHFPPEYKDTVFLGNPVTGRLNHDQLEVHGSTYIAKEQPDFLRCDDPWFRPVDIKLGPDGALYVADFYNRIIGHYEVPLTHPQRDRERGRIWRIVYTGEESEPKLPPVDDLSQASVEKLVDALTHPNFTVQVIAVEQLVDRHGEACLSAVRKAVHEGKSASQRALGLWIIERLVGLDHEWLARLAKDSDRQVRVHLMKVLAERPEWSEEGFSIRKLVISALTDEDPFVRRAAADALGRHPSDKNIRPLLDLWKTSHAKDTHLIHVVRMALRDQLVPEGVFDRLNDFAVDDGDRARLANVALGVASPAAGDWVVDYVVSHRADGTLQEYLMHAVRHAPEHRLGEIYRYLDSRRDRPLDEQVRTLQTVNQALQQRAAPLPTQVRDWAVQLGSALMEEGGEASVAACIELSRQLRLLELSKSLQLAAVPEAKHGHLRGPAIDALVNCNPDGAVAVLARILAEDRTFDLRQKSADLLGRMNTVETREVLASQLPIASQRLAVDIASALAASKDGGEVLLAAIREGKASPRVLTEKVVIERLVLSQLPNLEDEIRKLTAELPPVDDRLSQLIQQRKESFAAVQPDLVRGQAAFKKTCAACHQLSGQGNKIGPELDGVGIRGLDRLLEDVLDPNRNVDQAFRTTQVVTVDGQVISGLQLRTEGATLVLADSEGKEIRLDQDEIEQKRVSNLSPMPANVAELLPENEFYDLVGFLLSQRSQTVSAETGK